MCFSFSLSLDEISERMSHPPLRKIFQAVDSLIAGYPRFQFIREKKQEPNLQLILLSPRCRLKIILSIIRHFVVLKPEII